MSETKAIEKRQPTILELVERQAPEFEKVLPSHLGGQHGIRRFVRMAITTIKRTPKLAECDAASLMGCLMDCAQLGLEPDSVLGTAYIIPYGKTATLVIGYKGLVQLAYRGGQLQSLSAEVVYEKDKFEYSLGTDAKIIHVPTDEPEPGVLKYAYAVAELKGGAQIWRVMNRRDVERVKKSSRSASFSDSPWKNHEAEMWKKTAIRALAKMLPLSPEFADALNRDTETDSIEVSATATPLTPKLLGGEKQSEPLLSEGGAS